uniref:Si:ch211-12e13.12 n=1 Tax=Pygocentrus nattereri TaxID=42514 RepID=A0AAR2K4S1_PYGNA
GECRNAEGVVRGECRNPEGVVRGECRNPEGVVRGECRNPEGVVRGECRNPEGVILIDEDDDDMSLRERTVTDCSVTDGNAAQLVCGRLLSISSDSSPSVCEKQSQSLETEWNGTQWNQAGWCAVD